MSCPDNSVVVFLFEFGFFVGLVFLVFELVFIVFGLFNWVFGFDGAIGGRDMQDKKALEERDYVIKRFGMSQKELKAFKWLLHYGLKMAQDGKNSPLSISPEDWNENLEGACEKVIEGLDGK